MSLNVYDILWPAWVMAFFVIEGFALVHDLRNHPGPNLGATLSEHIRRWFKIKTNVGRTIFLWLTGGLILWFPLHILMGW